MNPHRLLLVLLLALLGGAAATIGVLGTGGSPHGFDGRCEMCHLVLPSDGEVGIFTLEIDSLCNDCHLMSETNSHPSGIWPSMEVPEELHLDWQGKVTCATCHDPHAENTLNNPDLLRGQENGRQFCERCHRELFAGSGEHAGVGGMAHAKAWTPPDADALERVLDPVSRECLECHDGLIGSDPGYSVAGDGSFFYRQRVLSHPIGIDYREATTRKRDLKPVEMLSPLVSLYEGKVGCASCHNPYSKEAAMLVFSDRRSALCLECHLK